MIDPHDILAILDQCSAAHTFPMLDNGYVYLAGTKLSLYRSERDWAMVIEVFGFSPRAGLPDTHLYTFASQLHDRDPPGQYSDQEAYDNYLVNNPHNESRFVYPVPAGPWQDAEDSELVAEDATEVRVRDRTVPIPRLADCALQGIELEQAPRVQVFELCRFLAGSMREQVLATPQERRISVPPDVVQILQLEEWHHPNLVADERPSDSPTFQQLARVLATGTVTEYRPVQSPNTHWRNWPEGGSL